MAVVNRHANRKRFAFNINAFDIVFPILVLGTPPRRSFDLATLEDIEDVRHHKVPFAHPLFDMLTWNKVSLFDNTLNHSHNSLG